MKLSRAVCLILAIMVLPAAACAEISLERGRELFTGTHLATNGKSCADCHPGGRGIEHVAGYSAERLTKIINKCVSKALEGAPLDADSSDMKSMVIYLKSLSDAERK